MCVFIYMENLKTYLLSEKMTQSKFAKKIGFSPSHLSEVMNSNKIPSLKFAYIIQQETKGRVKMDTWIINNSSLQNSHPDKCLY